MTAAQAGELPLDRRQVLKTAERTRDEGEAPAQVERRHVGLDEPDAPPYLVGLGGERGATAVEHLGREVEADDLVTGAGERQQNAPGAAGELEDGALVGRQGGPEGVVVAVGVHGVVDLGELG